MTEYRSETYKTVEAVEELLRKHESIGETQDKRLDQVDKADHQKEVVEEKKTSISSTHTREYVTSMEINQRKNELHLYPINDNEYIGAIDVDAAIAMNQPRTVFLLDSSESMGDETARFVKEIFPLVMSKLDYEESHLIDLISFGKECVHTLAHSNEDFVLTNSKLKSDGGTNFGPAIEKLRSRLEYYQRFSTDKLVRVLTILNGSIDDSDNAEKETKKLTDFLATTELTINSQAVRLFTSDSQPDTKALAYLLQINNTTETSVCDIKATESNEKIANSIVALFRSDGFESNQILEFEESIFLKFPWNALQSTQITLVPGWNSFWLKLVPIGAIKLDDSPIKVIIERQLTLAAFHELMETKLGYIADHMTILKIVGSTEAIRIVDKISGYFKNTEDVLAMKCSIPNKKVITNWLDGLAKNKTNFSDSAQMAEFLRMTHRRIERQRQKEKEAREEEIRRKKEVQEAQREIEAEREERFNQEEGNRIKREVEERVRHEVEERVKRQEIESLERFEQERVKRDEQKRIKKLEKERIERLENERLNQEKESFKREVEERVKREEMERLEQERMKQSEKKRLEQELVQQEQRIRRKMEELVIRDAEITTGTSESSPTIDSNAVQTVFIVDERDPRTRKGRLFAEKVIPLMLSKLFHENPQLVHQLTFVRHKTTVEQMVRSLQQTLDAKKAIRILVLTDGEVQERQNIEDFCETLTEFLSELNYSFNMEVVRITSTKKYKLIDIDASESNEFIAKPIPMQSLCSFHFIIFIIIFALLFVRYIYKFIF